MTSRTLVLSPAQKYVIMLPAIFSNLNKTDMQIPQLYVNHPLNAGEPPSVLKGFSDVELKAGEKEAVKITLSRYDLSVWDVVSQSWRRPEGAIKVTVGASSRDERLSGKFS